MKVNPKIILRPISFDSIIADVYCFLEKAFGFNPS